MYSLTWLIEGRIAYIEGSGNLTDDEVINLDQQMLAYLEQATATKIHFLFDTRDIDGLPGLKYLSAMEAPDHPAMGWQIVIGDMNPMVKFMVTMVAKINRARFQLVDSYVEALELLQKVDTTLPTSILDAV